MPAVAELLCAQHADRSAYERGGGYAALRQAITDPSRARQILLDTQLTGLGGAHFPFARKLQLALSEDAPRVVVCNAAEDEPGSQKDRHLIRRNPHLVIEGALIAALALDAPDVYFYVSEELTEAIAALDSALAEVCRDPAINPSARLHLFHAPSRYVAGEASAVIDAINGGEGKPLEQPPYPTERGVSGRPTLVSNCETIANLPRLLTSGLAGEALAGPPTRLATITGDVLHPGVYEVDPQRHTVRDLIDMAGGVAGSGVLKAFQPGGPSSAFLPGDAVDVPLSNDAIRAAGSQPGCLAMLVLAAERCIVEVVEQIADFFRREQCGQCPACRMKTQAYHRAIHQVAHNHGSWDLLGKLSAVDDFVFDMPRRCALINMPTPPLESAQKLFQDDFAAHIDGHTCRGSAGSSWSLTESEMAHG